ncbi:hypothetical protein E2C01_036948 [Portunus trituberculatus]|uniref:Secreted protein n=1 Tax=Portunus trituberculatus TaxID=210409 RepID=A0A5B7FCT1_PORTR|nr:hypothetical protein [Portunus trituberculatus]
MILLFESLLVGLAEAAMSLAFPDFACCMQAPAGIGASKHQVERHWRFARLGRPDLATSFWNSAGRGEDCRGEVWRKIASPATPDNCLPRI